MHWPEDEVSTDHSHPEVDVPKRIVEVASKHLGIPMVNACEHSEEGGHTHHDVEVSYHKHGIMQVDIDSRVTQEDTCQTTGYKQAYETNGEKCSRGKPDITAPD